MNVRLADRQLVFITGPAGSGTTMLSRFLSAPTGSLGLTRYSCAPELERQSAFVDEVTHRMWHVSNADKDAMRIAFGRRLHDVPVPETCARVILKRSCPFTNIQFVPLLPDMESLFPGTRFIIMQREPRHSASSLLRRKICGDITTAVDWTKKMYAHLTAQIAMLPAGSWRVLHYDRFIRQPETCVPDIERFLSLQKGELQPFRGMIGEPTQASSEIARQHADYLDRAFSDFIPGF